VATAEEVKKAGLTAAEVAERVRRGQVNRTKRSDWAEYRAIVVRNVCTLFNAIVVPAAVALFWLNDPRGAVAVSGFATINTLMGLIQEIRAKRQLEKLAILVETRARVLRDGEVKEVPAGDVVLDDHVLLSAGEAVVADGPVLEAHFLEVDEALLTGESDPVRRQPGDRLLSGSYCVAGEGAYRAAKVGGQSFAQSTSAEARSYRYTPSPLQVGINRLIQVFTYMALALCGVYLVLYWVQGFPTTALVQRIAATITSMIPVGLVLMATLAFTLGAVHMSRRGAVVQRLNAVETMASVDVVCTDKTGTLTTNRLRLDRLRVLARDLTEEDLRQRLAQFAWASLDNQNKSILALREALGRPAGTIELVDQIPFKSQNRYSAVRIRTEQGERTLVLGACEALQSHLEDPAASDWEAAWKELLATGLRILMFAESSRVGPFNGSLDGFPLRPLGLVALSDELRPEAGQVLEALHGQGIAFKILSGDNPETVRATVGHLKLPLAHEPVVSGDELEKASDKPQLIATRSVFGRVAPRQKVEIVRTLEEQGHQVAMIGDGVNDVLPIKTATLGIAMGEGSMAAKTVSGLVLENNNFALLPETLEEGRTIVRNLRRSAKLFLLKNVYSLILIVGAVAVFRLPFPFLPQQVTLLNLLTIGIPAFVITLSRERSTSATRPGFLREVLWFAGRTGVVMGVGGLVLGLIANSEWPWSVKVQALPHESVAVSGASAEAVGTFSVLSAYYEGVIEVNNFNEKMHHTLLLSFLVLVGVTALLRVLTDGETQPLIGDTKFRWLAVGAIPVYLLAMYLPPAADFFQLVPLAPWEWGLVLAVAVPAFLLCWLSDRLYPGRR
jgi:cation-transporting ATPase E